MHLPAGSLDNVTCTVTTLLAAGATGYAVRRLRRSPAEWRPAKLGAVAAFVFAGQMVNYPVADGVSGHMVGGVLAGSLLGPWAGLLAMALVLIAQCLLAGDGGLSTLGANILTMGVVATWGGAAMRAVFAKRAADNFGLRLATAAICAWASVLIAGAACAVVWTAGSAVAMGDVLGPMVSIHARIGMGEALITAAALAAVRVWSASIGVDDARRGFSLAVAAAVCAAALLAPWASASPDGLEHVASLHLTWPESPFAFAPLPDYILPGVANELLATALAGVIGTLAVFAFGSAAGHTLAVARAGRD